MPSNDDQDTKHRKWVYLLLLLFFSVFSFFMFIGTHIYEKERRAVLVSRATGILSEMERYESRGATYFRYRLRYEDSSGAKHKHTVTLAPIYRVGDTVGVKYDPANPADFEIDGQYSESPAIILILPLVLSVLFVIFFVPEDYFLRIKRLFKMPGTPGCILIPLLLSCVNVGCSADMNPKPPDLQSLGVPPPK